MTEKQPTSLIGGRQKKSPGLTRQDNIGIPTKTADSVSTSSTVKKVESRKGHVNQNATIKLSQEAKMEIELLMKMTDTKFTYEMIEHLIDYYINNALNADERRAIRALIKTLS